MYLFKLLGYFIYMFNFNTTFSNFLANVRIYISDFVNRAELEKQFILCIA